MRWNTHLWIGEHHHQAKRHRPRRMSARGGESFFNFGRSSLSQEQASFVADYLDAGAVGDQVLGDSHVEPVEGVVGDDAAQDDVALDRVVAGCPACA